MNATRQLTAADLKATEPILTEDAIIGIDRALSKYEEMLHKAVNEGVRTEAIADMFEHLRAAQSWLMHVWACRDNDEEAR